MVELENAGKKIQAESSKAENLVKELRPFVPAGGKADRVLTTAEGFIDKAKAGGNALRNVIGDDKMDELKEKAAEKVVGAGKKALTWGWGKLKERFT